jgi:hypothetical protein
MIFNTLFSSSLQRVLWVAALLAAVLLLTACGARDPALAPVSTLAPAIIAAQPASASRNSCPYCFCLDYSATCM